jgi:hypothetical protein
MSELQLRQDVLDELEFEPSIMLPISELPPKTAL